MKLDIKFYSVIKVSFKQTLASGSFGQLCTGVLILRILLFGVFKRVLNRRP